MQIARIALLNIVYGIRFYMLLDPSRQIPVYLPFHTCRQFASVKLCSRPLIAWDINY